MDYIGQIWHVLNICLWLFNALFIEHLLCFLGRYKDIAKSRFSAAAVWATSWALQLIALHVKSWEDRMKILDEQSKNKQNTSREHWWKLMNTASEWVSCTVYSPITFLFFRHPYTGHASVVVRDGSTGRTILSIAQHVSVSVSISKCPALLRMTYPLKKYSRVSTRLWNIFYIFFGIIFKE